MHPSNFPKTIRIFLMDGTPDGRTACELSNWSGKAYKIPRALLKQCADRPELNSTGVYLLFGKTEEETPREAAYIGEAENIFNRLSWHLREKDFWHEAVVFISKDDNLNKAHIKHLEQRMHEIACGADRFEILNVNTPTKSAISEPDRAEMEEFLENSKMLVSMLGYKVFETLRKGGADDVEEEDHFFIKTAKGANAEGQPTPEGFLVFRDSVIVGEPVQSCPPFVVRLRESLMQRKVVVESGGTLAFVSDHLFSSPSTAAAVVMGRSANGLIEWKTGEGRTLKMVESG